VSKFSEALNKIQNEKTLTPSEPLSVSGTLSAETVEKAFEGIRVGSRVLQSENLSIEEVSDYLQLPQVTIRHLARSGRLKPLPSTEPPVYLKDTVEAYAELLLNTLSERHTGSSNHRKNGRRRCLVQANAMVSIGPDVWSGEGVILNLGPGGMLFEFQKPFVPEGPVSRSGTVNLRVTLDPETRREIEVQGDILRLDVYPRTRLAVVFHEPRPEFSKPLS